MGIGAKSPCWRRAFFRLFASTSFRRTCRTENGTFQAYVSPGSTLKVLNFTASLVEPTHARFIRDWVKPDAVVWDIGGNLGLFAFPAALKARQIYVLEPDVDLAANLCKSVMLPANEGLNISVLCLAVAGMVGVAQFQVSKFGRAMNKLATAGRWNDSQVVVAQTRLVPVLTIDTLAGALAPPDVLKIDVEGAEIDVLTGGEQTIARLRPVMLIESPAELAEALSAFFARHNYVLLDADAEHPAPLDRPAWNTIAVPTEVYSNQPHA